MHKLVTRFGLAVVALLVMLSGSLILTMSAQAAPEFEGYVYTQSNASSGNQVLVFGRRANGSLTPLPSIWTGGNGTGAGLGSQGSLALSDNGKWLLVVNGGSSDISVISLKDGSVASRVSSGGTTPTSITVHGQLVYVLNHDSDSITGFRLNGNGALTAIPNSTRPLSGTGVDAKEIKFTRGGESLVVTEKNTNLIDTFEIEKGGLALGPMTHASSGVAPFGFDISNHNTVVVSEAAASAASSYQAYENGGLKLVTGSVVNGQVAACWVAITNSGRYAYTADAHNGKISSYAIANNGSLTLLDGVAGAPGGGPLDEAVTHNDKFLYVLNPSMGAINAFRIRADGSLEALAGASGIPASASGLVAQ